MLQNLEGKSAVVMGVANRRSIATYIAEELRSRQARIALSYLDDGKGRARKRIESVCEKLSPDLVEACDLNSDQQIKDFFAKVGTTFPSLDYLVHSVAFAPLEDIQAKTCDVSREGFLTAMESSVYSFIASVKEASMLMAPGSSIVTLSYFGAEKVMPGYNLMGVVKSALESAVRYLAFDLGNKGIRVNAISAGALKTLASSAISDFQKMLAVQEEQSPLKQRLLPEDVAKSALFLLSDEARSITGEVLHVDCGFNVMGAAEGAIKVEG